MEIAIKGDNAGICRNTRWMVLVFNCWRVWIRFVGLDLYIWSPSMDPNWPSFACNKTVIRLKWLIAQTPNLCRCLTPDLQRSETVLALLDNRMNYIWPDPAGAQTNGPLPAMQQCIPQSPRQSTPATLTPASITWQTFLASFRNDARRSGAPAVLLFASHLVCGGGGSFHRDLKCPEDIHSVTDVLRSKEGWTQPQCSRPRQP